MNLNLNFNEIVNKEKNYFKFGHAFLIGNTHFIEIKEELKQIINNLNDNNSSDFDNNPNIIIITPTNNIITKEQIIEMEKTIQTSSQSSKTKIYVISECEKMNLYASNSLLKTLEEPERNIIAFLITENINSVLPTIKSRCQIINVSHKDEKNIVEIFDEKLLELSINFVKKIEYEKIKAINYLNIYDKKIDKEQLEKIFIIMQYFYLDCIKYKNNMVTNYLDFFIKDIEQICNINTIEQLTSKSIIVNSQIKKTKGNQNINMLIDDLILKLGGME